MGGEREAGARENRVGRGTGGGEERVGSRSSKRAGSRREIRNTNFFNSIMYYDTFKNKKPKYIWLACIVYSVTSETSEKTSK